MESNPGSGTIEATAEAVRQPPRDLSPAIAATAPGQLRVIKRNGAVVMYDDDKIQIALTKAFPRRRRRHRRRLVADSRVGGEPVRRRHRHLPSPPAFRRHHPHRGHPRPGRARPDALRPAQGCPRLCALPRGAGAGAGRQGPRGGRSAAGNPHHGRRRPAPRIPDGAHPDLGGRSLRRARRRGAEPHHRRSPGEHVRRHFRRRCRRQPHHDGAHAGRGRAELHPRRRPAAVGPASQRSAFLPRRARTGDASGDEGGLSRGALCVRGPRHRARTARAGTQALRHRAARRGAQARAGSGVHLPRPANPLRPLFHPLAGHPLRAAAGVLHARGDGAGDPGGRPRGARHRVLQPVVFVQLFVFDADAVQRRHAALAALVLLPHHGFRRSRRHLQRHPRQRAAVEVGRGTRQRLDPGARPRRLHQGHQRQVARRGAVPEGGQRHRRGGEPVLRAQHPRAYRRRHQADSRCHHR